MCDKGLFAMALPPALSQEEEGEGIWPLLSPLLGPAYLPRAPQAGPAHPLPARTPARPHLKSPSWYLPNACRTMVTKAMMGFTTQNCNVAWGWGGE